MYKTKREIFNNSKQQETMEITSTMASNSSAGSNNTAHTSSTNNSNISSQNLALEPSGSPRKTPSEWYSLLQFKRKSLNTKELIDLYAQAMKLLDYKKYANDYHLVAIWLEFIQLQMTEVPPETVLKFYEKMSHLGIGSTLASYYIQWAEFDKKSAIEILNLGIKNKARPISSVMMQLKKLEDSGKENNDGNFVKKDFNKESLPLMKNKENYRNAEDDDIPPPPVLSTENIPQSTYSQAESNTETRNHDLTNATIKVEHKEVEVIQQNNTQTMIVEDTIQQSKIMESHVENDDTYQSQKSVGESRRAELLDSVSRSQHQSSNSFFNKKNSIVVNGKAYCKLEVIGKGGSSKVFKVLATTGSIYAVKRVQLRGVESATVSGYLNEIALLKKLTNCDRIIKLFDSEINQKDGFLHMVMECGEIDLAHVLRQMEGRPVSLNFVRVHWEQMLQAVHAIHEERVIHSDLKPANFLFVRGGLKLIDFGIAKAIQNDTTNIHRDHQVGTVNYMSPEAIVDTNAMKGESSTRTPCMKLGRASDVWSLGCILYQMVFSKTPFAHLQMYQKMHAIVDPDIPIEYPPCDNPHLVDIIKSCLHRDPKKRKTIPELLEHPFMHPDKFLKHVLSRDKLAKIVYRVFEEQRINPKATAQEITRALIAKEL